MAHLDTHCHWDDPRFEPERALHVARARAAGITRLLVPGLDVASWKRALPLPPDFQAMRAAGLHPVCAHQAEDLAALAAVLATGAYVAVGEAGLDRRCRRPGDVELLAAQLDLATQHRLPVILHVVHAHEEVLALLQARPGLGGIVHAFSGSKALARRYLDRGFVIGVGGSLSWAAAHKLQATVATLPAEGFVLETDAPDMAPAWRKGELNEPAELRAIAALVGLRRDMEPEAVLARSDANAARILGRDA